MGKYADSYGKLYCIGIHEKNNEIYGEKKGVSNGTMSESVW